MSPLRNALAALVLVSGAVLAAGPAAAQDQGDPPADVARVAVVSGAVSTHQPGSQDWQAAQQNYPLAPGSGVWTEPRSHAAVDVAGARVHVDASSQLEITAIDQGQVRLALAQGAAYMRVYPGVSGVSFEIDTAHGAAYINQPGQYEIVAGDDQHPASLSVMEGQAQFVGQNANLALQAAQRGNITPDNQSTVDAAQPDDFVRMVQQQEQPYQQQVAQTAQYVSPQQTGYQDLARYGQWDQAPQYGAVWYPQAVAADWAPYRYGHWAYVAPWGWTWVDDAPWGFTPFHYGRWVQIGPRWGWVPGVRAARPVYAPALVSFFDLGGVGVSLSLGWVPLGPNEVYVPAYRHSQRYVRDVNITNVRNETTIINVVNRKTVINVNNYANYRGATSASRDVMAGGRAVGPAWGKTDKAKAAQQWSHAKPDRAVAFRPESKAPPSKGPKLAPQPQHPNGQPSAKPSGKPTQPKVAKPQSQPQKNWNNAGKPNQPKGPVPQPQGGKSWNKPNNAAAKPKPGAPQPYLPPANRPAQSFGKPQGATPKPEMQPQPRQEQTARKAQWKAQQQQKPQAQQQSGSRQNQQQTRQQWKQQRQPNAGQHAEKTPNGKPAPAQQQKPQQKKPAQNCGQQGACQ